MSDQLYEVVVSTEEVSAAVNKGASQGWRLVNSTPEDDDQVRLVFQRDAPANLQPYGFPNQAQVRPVDPNVAWLELLGLLGFLGIGYLVAGHTNDGLIRLVGFIAFSIIGWTIVTLLSFIIIGLCLIPVMLAAQVGIPIWSALELKKELEQAPNI